LSRYPIRVALLAAGLALGATGACAKPPQLLGVTFTGGCDSFAIAVTGQGLDQPTPIVSYNIKLTPRSGSEPFIIVDSFPVTPDADGAFRKTIRQSWKKFEFTPAGKYTLSGSAVLTSKITFLHTIPISFHHPKLSCARR